MVTTPRSVGSAFLRSAGTVLAGLLIVLPAIAGGASRPSTLKLRATNIGNGITLHYVEEGSGAPVIFVHGSIGDYSYWLDEVDAFGTKYRAIAYSRRYNYPNTNP